MSEATPVQAAEQPITITRVFDAPRELVFKAWTEPDQVAQWFGPAGFETPREGVEIDLRVGGRYNLRMVQRGTGMEYWLRYEIVDLVEPELLVLKSSPICAASISLFLTSLRNARVCAIAARCWSN